MNRQKAMPCPANQRFELVLIIKSCTGSRNLTTPIFTAAMANIGTVRSLEPCTGLIQKLHFV